MNLFSKYNWVLILLACVGFFQCNSTIKKEKDTRPNVILILTDDLGAGDLGCAGHPYAKTPNIDQLAAEGIRFTKAYMSAAWCAPSRYALMRGMHPAREFYETYHLQTDQPSVTSLLQESGYATAHVGKWHLGSRNPSSPSPTEFGIDFQVTTSSSAQGWTNKVMKERYFRATSADRFVDHAIDFVSKNKDKPFYLNLWVQPTHSYIDPTPEQLARYADLKVDLEDFNNPQQREFLEFVAKHGDIDKAIQAYCADLTALDGAVGCLLDTLKKLGIEDNTIVAFSSDNGPGPLTSQVINESVVKRYIERPTLLNNVGSAGDYGERKLSVKDGGTHVPFIVKWPKEIQGGLVDNKTILSGLDWVPTITKFAGIQQLPDVIFDGKDMSKAVLGEPVIRKEPIFWYESGKNSAILDENWKGVMIGGQFALYDLNKDEGEVNDLSTSSPEKAKEIKNKLQTWMDQMPVPKPQVKGRNH
ncbi:MAG: sulfatase-like hydrolase/transferase [Cyclobacteriaceae bacterium]